jgi:hypothetical protein
MNLSSHVLTFEVYNYRNLVKFFTPSQTFVDYKIICSYLAIYNIFKHFS